MSTWGGGCASFTPTSQEERDRPLLAMTWDYPLEGALQEPRAESVLEEISGYTVSDGQQVAGFADLKDDGSTACGCWIYSGVIPAKGRNLSASRIKDGPDEWTNNSRWGWSWPANRRILYNRASADPDGNPWSERKRLVWWDSMRQRWQGSVGRLRRARLRARQSAGEPANRRR